MAKTTYKKKIKNGKEYYFFRLRHKNLPKPKDIYATTVKELTEKIKRITRELDFNVVDTKETFISYFEDWLFEVNLINKKPSTCERYEGLYRKYIKNSCLSKFSIKDIKAADIQKYYNDMLNNGIASVSTIRQLNKLICPCIRHAYNNDMIIKDFTKAIVLPKESESTILKKENTIKPFTLQEQQLFIEAIKGNDLEILFLTDLNTGLRQGELLALEWSDIDLENATINVNKTVKYVTKVTREGRQKGQMLVQTTKTQGSNRILPLPNFLVSLLKDYKKEQAKHILQLGNLYEKNNLVFANSYGRYYDPNNIRKRFNKILAECGIKDKHFHDLRHTYATRLFELGELPKTVQKLLGHANLSITMDTYTHVLEEVKRDAVNKLDTLYNSINKTGQIN